MPEPRRTLAADLRYAETNLRATELKVEALLSRLFPRWKGWRFTTPDGIDVFEAEDSPDAVRVLHGEGFNTVTLHKHRAEQFLTCVCKPRELGRDR